MTDTKVADKSKKEASEKPKLEVKKTVDSSQRIAPDVSQDIMSTDRGNIKEPKKIIKETEKTSEFAVIKTGGKQYVVSVGDVLTIEKLDGDFKEGDKVTFDKVLLVDNGKDTTTIGTPFIKGAKVIGSFQETGKGKKIHVIRFKSKSRYFKKYGHRQPYTKVKIEALK